ncbi:unnamed protein product, partial [Ectocarpus sp. 13 AM-2016]
GSWWFTAHVWRDGVANLILAHRRVSEADHNPLLKSSLRSQRLAQRKNSVCAAYCSRLNTRCSVCTVRVLPYIYPAALKSRCDELEFFSCVTALALLKIYMRAERVEHVGLQWLYA